MSRRRYQKPKVFQEGNFWKVRVREDALNDKGKVYRARPQHTIGPCTGPRALTEKQAQKRADEDILKPVNDFINTPQSVLTVEEFYTKYFDKEVVQKLKHSGKEHYKYCWGKIGGFLGKMRLRDVSSTDISTMTTKLAEKGYAPKTVSHIKTATTTIFNFAKRKEFRTGDNPARLVRLEEVSSPERYAYSPREAQAILERLQSPILEAVFMAVTTSLNVAELCGLKRKRVNLTDKTLYSAGEAIPPFSLLVREQYYRNRWGTVKKQAKRKISARYRTVGIPDHLVGLLAKLMIASQFQKPEDPVFCSRNGTPIDAHNVNNRIFKKIQTDLGIPVSWHLFRHSTATFAEALGMPLSDRMALMGQARAEMTQHYTHSDVDRRRQEQNKLAEQLIPERHKQIKRLMEMPVGGAKQ
ncbi:MAG TPA: tyrosine-type recombinase/integrase [Candidatus Acidoferrales bacterium]|nr:tyrosine-type recombinase/integrase [Candidatus Acidoferrales bacterium]